MSILKLTADNSYWMYKLAGFNEAQQFLKRVYKPHGRGFLGRLRTGLDNSLGSGNPLSVLKDANNERKFNNSFLRDRIHLDLSNAKFDNKYRAEDARRRLEMYAMRNRNSALGKKLRTQGDSWLDEMERNHRQLLNTRSRKKLAEKYRLRHRLSNDEIRHDFDKALENTRWKQNYNIKTQDTALLTGNPVADPYRVVRNPSPNNTAVPEFHNIFKNSPEGRDLYRMDYMNPFNNAHTKALKALYAI